MEHVQSSVKDTILSAATHAHTHTLMHADTPKQPSLSFPGCTVHCSPHLQTLSPFLLIDLTAKLCLSLKRLRQQHEQCGCIYEESSALQFHSEEPTKSPKQKGPLLEFYIAGNRLIGKGGVGKEKREGK